MPVDPWSLWMLVDPVEAWFGVPYIERPPPHSINQDWILVWDQASRALMLSMLTMCLIFSANNQTSNITLSSFIIPLLFSESCKHAQDLSSDAVVSCQPTYHHLLSFSLHIGSYLEWKLLYKSMLVSCHFWGWPSSFVLHSIASSVGTLHHLMGPICCSSR